MTVSVMQVAPAYTEQVTVPFMPPAMRDGTAGQRSRQSGQCCVENYLQHFGQVQLVISSLRTVLATCCACDVALCS